MAALSARVEKADRIVVKIGSSLLTDGGDGAVRQAWLAALADDVAALRARGKQVMLVSSGAIAVGRRRLGMMQKALRLEDKQACAAVGQIRLAHAYQQALDRHGITVAQVLLTLQDSDDRRRYLNARNTIESLLRLGALPLINENDTVATEEIRFGDNDRLAARVAQMAGADLLVLLSDIDGFYTADPGLDDSARRLDEVTEITPEIEAMAGGSLSDTGSGGMVTKIAAARIAVSAGCDMLIGAGAPDHALAGLVDGAPCTWFSAKDNPLTARKRWIAGSLQPAGSVVIDDGALRALGTGNSLLPAGVVAARGGFRRGDLVLVNDRAGRELGRGLSAYSADDVQRILGHKSNEIERILGYRGREEVIHRDDLVLVPGGSEDAP
jgi:glutamate 5-kinase